MQKVALPPLIKRQIPEGYDYRIVIPENVEYIIRKFCASMPDNEWSGTLFFEVEGDFDSPSFKIICRDFLLMDLGSSAFTEFNEDGTAIDYMAQHPELLDCQMGLLHSHDKMATFFSGTDTNTLRIEGFDRNNFVSLIVNNAGVYSAAITRKVEYVENHSIEIKGSYPFFGTKRVLETPTTSTSEEKKKLLIEYFDLTIEKQEVSYNPSDYDEMFNSLITKKFLRGYTKTGTPGYYQGYPKTYTPPTYPQVPDDDDEGFDYAEYYRNKFLKKEETKVKEETTVQGSLFDDEELFDSEFVKSALDMPVMQFRLKELLLEIVTGCPIISKWVKTYEITDKIILDALDAFKDKKFTPAVYESFVYDNIKQRFEMLIPTDYFPGSAKVDDVPDFELENILIIKMIDMAGELKASDYSIALVNALKDFYSV